MWKALTVFCSCLRSVKCWFRKKVQAFEQDYLSTPDPYDDEHWPDEDKAGALSVNDDFSAELNSIVLLSEILFEAEDAQSDKEEKHAENFD